MFYIISSRIPIISSDKTKRKYFKLFVLGSIIYILLHYYLNKNVRSGIIEKIRKYIYFIMIIDFSIACILLKYIKTNIPDIDDNYEYNDNESENKNINNMQKLNLELQEQRRLFLEEHNRKLLQEKYLKQKELEQKELKEKELKEKAIEQHELEQKKIKKEKEIETETETESETESEKESEKKPKKKSKEKAIKSKDNLINKNVTEENLTDTEIPLPIYNN